MNIRTVIKFGTILLFCCTALPLFAQERVIDKKEFDTVYTSALNKLEKRVYRSSYSSESISGRDQSVRSNTNSLYESVPPNRKHSIYSSTSSKGSHKYENITIGEKTWYRVNDGVWKLLGSGSGSGSGSGDGSSARRIEHTMEYKINVGDTIDGVAADHYQFTEVIKWENSTGVVEETTRRGFWVRKDGLLVRSEYENVDGLRNTSNKTSTKYEYPKHIEINAPDVYEEEKGSDQ
jgi:hypothetical protein